jgi:hypothetical protein
VTAVTARRLDRAQLGSRLAGRLESVLRAHVSKPPPDAESRSLPRRKTASPLIIARSQALRAWLNFAVTPASRGTSNRAVRSVAAHDYDEGAHRKSTGVPGLSRLLPRQRCGRWWGAATISLGSSQRWHRFERPPDFVENTSSKCDARVKSAEPIRSVTMEMRSRESRCGAWSCI